MTRKLLLKPILIAALIFSMITVPTISAHSAEISERLMRMLQWEEIYGMPASSNPETWLKSYLKVLLTDLENNPTNPDLNHLLIGDAYHWLGHLLSELGRPEEAFLAHKQSLEYYRKADALFSPAINFYWPQGHAHYHLAQLSQQLGYEIQDSWRKGWHLRGTEWDQETEKKAYKKAIEMIKKRQGCESFFNKSE